MRCENGEWIGAQAVANRLNWKQKTAESKRKSDIKNGEWEGAPTEASQFNWQWTLEESKSKVDILQSRWYTDKRQFDMISCKGYLFSTRSVLFPTRTTITSLPLSERTPSVHFTVFRKVCQPKQLETAWLEGLIEVSSVTPSKNLWLCRINFSSCLNIII